MEFLPQLIEMVIMLSVRVCLDFNQCGTNCNRCTETCADLLMCKLGMANHLPLAEGRPTDGAALKITGMVRPLSPPSLQYLHPGGSRHKVGSCKWGMATQLPLAEGRPTDGAALKITGMVRPLSPPSLQYLDPGGSRHKVGSCKWGMATHLPLAEGRATDGGTLNLGAKCSRHSQFKT